MTALSTLPTLPFGVAVGSANARAPEPPPGVYVQIYRGKVPGSSAAAKRAQLARYCDQLAALGCPGVVMHGFCEDLQRNWDGLATIAANSGLLALAAWGLDSKDLTAAHKGALVGDVLARSTCAAGALDAEGQYDTDTGPADDMDEAGALDLGRELRRRAPRAYVVNQPWYAIDSHGDVRVTAKPLGQGGCFRGFPIDEFSSFTDAHYRQAYIYNALGAGYASTFKRMDREWETIRPAMERAGLSRPLRVTVQGYRWKLHELIDCLINRGVCPNVPVMMWAEPMPDAVAVQAIRAVCWLQAQGFARPGVSADVAVRAAQTGLNVANPSRRLTVDGEFGPATYAATGLP